MARACWDLAGIAVAGECRSDPLWRCWQNIFAAAAPADGATIRLSAAAGPVPDVPPPAELLLAAPGQAFYRHEAALLLHLPQVALLSMDPRDAHSTLLLAPPYQSSEPLVEDLLAVALAPHLRRRDRFLLHAFGAAHSDGGVILVGDSGAGKTTSGMALLAAGWGLLGNDVVQFDGAGMLYGYPGRIAAAPESMARFAATAALAGEGPAGKLRFAAEEIWPGCRRASAPPARILFPRIVNRPDCALQPLSAAEALARLLPHTLDRWDAPLLGAHLAAAEALVRRAPAADLLLGRHLAGLADLLRPARSTTSR